MKKIHFLLCIFIFISGFTSLKAQRIGNKLVTVDKSESSYRGKHKVALEKALEELGHIYNVNIMYESKLIKGRSVYLKNLNRNSFDKSLRQLLDPYDLNYRRINNNSYAIQLVVPELKTIKKIKIKDHTVTGTVTDSDNGVTLPGVNILIKGTTRGTSTNLDGEYSVSMPSPNDTLVFSYIGYQTRQIPVNGRSSIDVQLDPKSLEGQEIVVVGYAKQKKVTVTGSVSSVSTNDILKAPTANIGNALVGKVSGLQTIQRSGMPGADDPQIFIRGIGSLSEGRSQPLIIVDGVERQSFTQLDPNNIESISVLKDASATAVYGVRGANGVIIISTKRGNKGPVKISVNMSSGLQQPTTSLKFADSYTYAQRYNEAQMNDGLSPDNVRFSPKALNAFKTNSDPIIYPNTDWVDYIMKPVAFQTRNNINISGGTDNVRYYVAGGFLKQNGMFKSYDTAFNNNFSYNRYNFRTNLDIDVTPTTQINLTAGGRNEVRKRPITKDGLGQLFRLIYWSVPFSGPGIVDGKYIRSSNYYINDEKKDGLDPFYGRGYNKSIRSTLNLDLGVSQKLDFLTKGLLFKLKVSTNTYFTQNKNRSSSQPYYEPYYRTDVDPSALGDSTIVYKKMGSAGILGYGESYGKDRSWYMDARFVYQKSLGRHNFKALALYNERKNFYPGTFPGIPRGLVGMAGRLNYNYDSRYLFELNLGYNGSENFAKGNRFGFFPAVSAGWNVTNERFMKNIGFLDYLKLRASYGLVGNDQGVGRFLYLPDSYYASARGYNFGNNVPQDQTGASEGQIGNPLVQWETATKQNYGIDMRVLNDQLSVSFDYFFEHRDNILTTRNTIPAYVAADLPAVNIGKVENKGFEVEVKWRQRLGAFQYHINGNVSFARNKILYMDEVPRNEPYLYRTGHAVGQRFGYVFDGYYTAADTANIANLPDQQINAKPGDLKYKDLNGDGVIDTDDQRAIGYPEYPEYTLGANIGFNFKNFDLTMIWAGATHTSRLLSDTPYRSAFGPTGNRGLMQWQAEKRWTPENAQNAEYPRLTFSGKTNNMKDSNFWMRDASYLRLKNIEIGYSLQPKMLENLGIRRLRAYINGYNLWTFSKLKIADPEQNTASRSDYPIVKVYNLGLKISF